MTYTNTSATKPRHNSPSLARELGLVRKLWEANHGIGTGPCLTPPLTAAEKVIAERAEVDRQNLAERDPFYRILVGRS